MSFVSKVVFYNNQLHQISVFEIDCVHLAEFLQSLLFVSIAKRRKQEERQMEKWEVWLKINLLRHDE